MALDYAIYDVFTARPLAGNPLAVVFDADDLDEARMQAIAAEFNLSETIFLSAARSPSHSASARIFTPRMELPFAGHPTVGGAIALAERQAGKAAGVADGVHVLEEAAGAVRCAVRLVSGKPGYCAFDLPHLSEFVPHDFDRDAIAAALGIEPNEIGFENHLVSCWSAGVPFVLVPICDLSAIERAALDPALWVEAAPAENGRRMFAYVYCRGGRHHETAFHCRMFAASAGIGEDPATGAAVAALSGAIHRFDNLLNGRHACLIEQGVEMGRPSFIQLHMHADGGRIVHARIGGEAVKVAQGVLSV